MGQKVNPIGFRIGVIRTWDSRWFAKGPQYVANVHEDLKFRNFIKSKLKHAGVARIEMERAPNKIKIIIYSARPGVVIGKKGAGLDALKAELQKLTPNQVYLDIKEVRKPDLDAQLVAENIALQL
ncbi:MAG: 30S ribosomal protein S3, partial [Bacteroidetes bacterium]|nr:30S ribosomal protein S3 [Bacteroidota bacterium]